MTIKQQTCLCGNHEIVRSNSNDAATFESYTEQSVSDVLINPKILLKAYKFNIHYLVGRDEWHFRQFDDPRSTVHFCRQLGNTQIYKIFHQISATFNGESEIVARQINRRTCEQMANDKFANEENKVQTAYKLALKICNSMQAKFRNRTKENTTEI